MNPSMTADQIRQIIQSLDELTANEAVQNRRCSPRSKSQLALRITLIGHDSDQFTDIARLQDYSDSGIGMIRIQPMVKNQMFHALWVQADGQSVEVMCQAVSCVQLEDGAYRIGAQFSKMEHAPKSGN